MCKTCSRSFKFQSGLYRHNKTHNGTTMSCACGIKFTRLDNMKRHHYSGSCTVIRRVPAPSTNESFNSNLTHAIQEPSTDHAKEEQEIDDVDDSSSNEDSGYSSNSSLIKRQRAKKQLKGLQKNRKTKNNADSSDDDSGYTSPHLLIMPRRAKKLKKRHHHKSRINRKKPKLIKQECSMQYAPNMYAFGQTRKIFQPYGKILNILGKHKRIFSTSQNQQKQFQ